MKKYNIKSIPTVAVLALSFYSVACSTSTGNITTVSAQTFERSILSPDIQLVDVRSAQEYEEGHIVGASNIDVESPDFLELTDKRLDKHKPVYLYCRGGRRSKEAAEMLVQEGYEIVNLDGGINNWKSEGLPVIKGNMTE